MMKEHLLKLMKAKKRNEIRHGKLWEITRVWKFDISTVELEPPRADPFVKPEGMAPVDKLRVHVIKGENNVTNLTKNADLL